jgi:two-component system, LytTR family, response regulator
MKALLIDDEPKNNRILSTLINDFCEDISTIRDAHSIEEALETIEKYKPDIIFLDIEMPNGNAFDLLDRLTKITFQIIFVTAFESYSLKAIKYNALDYLLKPVNIEDLQEAVKKAINNTNLKNIDLQVKSLLQNISATNSNILKIALQTMDGLEFVKTEDIMHIKAEGNYSVFHLKNKISITTSKNIKEYEGILPQPIFHRVHHAHIVNINYVKKYFKGRGGYLLLEDETTVEVSTRRKSDFLSKFE